MNNDFFAHVFAVSGFLFFGGPMTAICVLYVLIGIKLKRSHLLQALPRRSYDVNRGISAQTRVIRMLGKCTHVGAERGAWRVGGGVNTKLSKVAFSFVF